MIGVALGILALLSGISKVEIERASNKARISIHTAKPGMVIGRQGSNIELLKSDHVKSDLWKIANISCIYQTLDRPELVVISTTCVAV